MSVPTAYDDSNILRKASSIITATTRGEVLTLHDHKLMNYLLHRAHDDLAPSRIYRIPMKEAMDYMRIKRSGELQASIRRLSQVLLEIDYVDTKEEARCIMAHFLSADVSLSENGMLFYAFDQILYNFIEHPKVYAKIAMDRSGDMPSIAASRLYEVMALQYHKKQPVYKATPEELRTLLVVGDRHPRPDNFRRLIVDKTVEEVNAIAEFDVRVEYTKGGHGGSVIEFVFTALTKSHARLIEASATKLVGTRKTASADQKTIDMLDGMTGEERGAPASLTAEGIEGARAMMPEDGNIDEYIAEWRSQSKNKTFSDPDQAFLAWLQSKLDKDNDPLLKDLESDVWGELLGEAE